MPSHNTIDQRDHLRSEFIAVFAAQPQILSIHAFGREVEGKCDAYSDLDLVICSSDLAASHRQCLPALNAISPVVGIYRIVCEERHMAMMVMLRDYSPYQKIDFSITDDLESKSAFAPFKCLYASSRPASLSPTSFSFNGQRETLANRLNDQLFAIPRFTKCLFHRDRDLYRRWIGVTEHLAVLLHESYFGFSREHRYRLHPQEYKALHGALKPADAARLEEIQPLDRSPDIPTSYALAMRWLVELYTAKAATLGDGIDAGFATYILDFLTTELERYRAARLSSS